MAGGLALLPDTRGDAAYAGTLPGVPDQLEVGSQFTISTEALGYLGSDSVPGGTRFVITGPDARDISRLAGDSSGRIMFPAETRFRVTGIAAGRDGQQVIRLAHPARESRSSLRGTQSEQPPDSSRPTPAPVQPSAAVPSRDASSRPGAGGRARVHHIEGSVLRFKPVDAIVNAAHNKILGAGGISGRILARGGDAMADEIRAILKNKQLPTGAAVTTRAHGFPDVSYVIHAVPPDFRPPGTLHAPYARGISPESRELLAQAYRSALKEADRLKLRSVAFSTLSGAIFRGRLSVNDVERIALDALRGASTNVQDVYLVRYEPITGDPLPRPASPAERPVQAAAVGGAGVRVGVA